MARATRGLARPYCTGRPGLDGPHRIKGKNGPARGPIAIRLRAVARYFLRLARAGPRDAFLARRVLGVAEGRDRAPHNARCSRAVLSSDTSPPAPPRSLGRCARRCHFCRTAKTYSILPPPRGPQSEKAAFLGPCKPTGRHPSLGVTRGATNGRPVTCRTPWRGGAVLQRRILTSALSGCPTQHHIPIQ